MTAFKVRDYSRKSRALRHFRPCENGCVARASSAQTTGFREATHHIVLVGRSACWLCGPCAKEAQRVWDDARAGFPEVELVA